MSEPVLVIRNSGRGIWRVVWYFPDDGENGATLGEGGVPIPKQWGRSRDAGKREAYAIDRALIEFPRDNCGFWWESKDEARRAMALAQAACESAHAAKPWPAWAVKARAAGWKAPKGWKP